MLFQLTCSAVLSHLGIQLDHSAILASWFDLTMSCICRCSRVGRWWCRWCWDIWLQWSIRVVQGGLEWTENHVKSVIVGMQLEDIIVNRLHPNTPIVLSCWGLLCNSLTCLGWTINHSYCARSQQVTSSKARFWCLKMARVVRFCCLHCSLLL